MRQRKKTVYDYETKEKKVYDYETKKKKQYMTMRQRQTPRKDI